MARKQWLPIGTHVLVRAIMVRGGEGNYRAWTAEGCARRHGVITGVGLRFDGYREPGTRSGEYGEDYDPPYFAVTKALRVYLVKFALSGREYPVHQNDIEALAGAGVLPFTVNKWPPSEETRTYLRAEMKAWPRDASGRWLKQTKGAA